MNLRRRKPHDSLYMLLDTMCNAFGGIILLAVLVVLLTSKEKTQSATSADSTEMLQRRVALAQTNLQKSLQLATSLQTQASDDRWKTQVPLLTTRQQLEDEIKQIRDLAAQNAQQLDANSGTDPSERLKNINAQLVAGEIKKLTAQNRIEAAKEEKKNVAARLTKAEKQMAEVAKLSQRELRLPKEHDTDRQVVFAIVHFGRIYFCRNADLTRNETDIHWTEKEGVEYADPQKTRGSIQSGMPQNCAPTLPPRRAIRSLSISSPSKTHFRRSSRQNKSPWNAICLMAGFPGASHRTARFPSAPRDTCRNRNKLAATIRDFA